MNLSHLQASASKMARRAASRRAMTILELIAVVAIIGMLSVMAASRYGSLTVADVDGQGYARRLALDCAQARRRAIATGENHLIRFTVSGGVATQYGLYRRSGASTTLVDDVHATPTSVTVTTSATDLEFSFAGEALAAYTVTIAAPHRTRTITIPIATGKAAVQ